LPAPIIPTITTVFLNLKRDIPPKFPHVPSFAPVWREIIGKAIYTKEQKHNFNHRQNRGVPAAEGKMGRLIKWILILVLIGGVVLVGHSIFGDLSAPEAEVTREVIIDVD
jgi:hypothetical protein